MTKSEAITNALEAIKEASLKKERLPIIVITAPIQEIQGDNVNLSLANIGAIYMDGISIKDQVLMMEHIVNVEKERMRKAN